MTVLNQERPCQNKNLSSSCVRDLSPVQVFISKKLKSRLVVTSPMTSRCQTRDLTPSRRFLTRTDGVFIEDMGSTNGTFLNGVRISSPQRLNNGDLITMAESTVMSFEWPDQAKTPTYSAYPQADSTPEPAPQAPASIPACPETGPQKAMRPN